VTPVTPHFAEFCIMRARVRGERVSRVSFKRSNMRTFRYIKWICVTPSIIFLGCHGVSRGVIRPGGSFAALRCAAWLGQWLHKNQKRIVGGYYLERYSPGVLFVRGLVLKVYFLGSSFFPTPRPPTGARSIEARGQ
jgi:hypothetical protein